MAASSAVNMKTNFDVQLLEISDAFSNTALNISTAFITSANDIITQITNAFMGIDTAAITSNANVSASFSSLMTLLYQNFDATQIYGSESFRFLSENSVLSFTQASGMINNELNKLNGNIGSSSTNIATIITQNMLGAFALISAGIILTGTVITGVLNQVNLAFQNTANLANAAFDNVQINIEQNMLSISGTVIQNNEKSGTSWFDSKSYIFDYLGAFSNLLTILKTFGLINATNIASQTLATTATAAQAGASTAAGVSFTSAAVGALAFGGGVLALGAGVLLTGMAISLLAKTAFNALKMLGRNTHGVKASDFDLSFSIPGLAAGGFPSMGQMFIAREAGPELVGTIGGRNAVVNNNQIVESISAGVYKAVREAMGSGNRSDKIVMTLDKKVLGEATIGYINGKTRQTGLSPILV